MNQSFMKILMVNASNGFFARNFLRTDASSIIGKSGRLRVVVLVPKSKLDYYKKEFLEPYLAFDALPETRPLFWESVFEFIDHATVHSKTTWMFHTTEFYRRGGNIVLRLARLGARRLCWFLGQFKTWRKWLRWFYYILPSSAYAAMLDKYQPEAVFCPTMVYHDQLILKEAKKRGIKIIGAVLSWDNLFTKTYLRVHPDQLLTQTSIVRDQAARMADYPPDRITVVGIPQYDRYFRTPVIMPREEFIRGLGGDSSRKLILYAFSGKLALDIEFNVLDVLAKIISAGELRERVNVLVRPYPRFDFSQDKLVEFREKYGFLGMPAVAHTGGSSNDWEFDEEALNFLMNSLAHADAIISMYSTFFIEGAIFDKPLIAAAFDGYKKLDYWHSAARFFEWDHLASIRDFGGIDFARSPEDLARALQNALANPANGHEGRKKIVAQQCEYTDGQSGERVGKAILDFLTS